MANFALYYVQFRHVILKADNKNLDSLTPVLYATGILISDPQHLCSIKLIYICKYAQAIKSRNLGRNLVLFTAFSEQSTTLSTHSAHQGCYGVCVVDRQTHPHMLV